MAVSPSIVSGRVVATTIRSSVSSILYERNDDAELEQLFRLVSRNAEHSPTSKRFLIDLPRPVHQKAANTGNLGSHLQIGQRGIQLNTPINESVGTIDPSFSV